MKLQTSFLCIIVIIALVSTTTQSIRFEIESGHTKCIAEDIKSNSMTVGHYSIVNPNEGNPLPESHRITLRVTSSYGNSYHSSENVQSGQFAFQAVEAGDYMACFFAIDHQPPLKFQVEFDWRSGVASKDWSNVAKKGSVDRSNELDTGKEMSMPDGVLMNAMDLMLIQLESYKKCKLADGLGLDNMGPVCYWKWKRRIVLAPECVELDSLTSILAGVNISFRKDSWVWLGDRDGEFRVGAVRKLLYNQHDFSNNYVLKWYKWVPSKCNIFIWRVDLNKIATMAVLRDRNLLAGNATCVLCGGGDETVDHLFTSCWFASLIWDHISSWSHVQKFFVFSFRDLIELHKHVGLSGNAKMVFHSLIYIGCWSIWRARNGLKFEGKRAKLEEAISEIKSVGFLWLKNRSKLKSTSWSDWCKSVFM